ncbi:tyrosine-type recombinase/integrase [Christiangramia sp. SM2212]|uniref:Tyrosine-type recombinase/integrase n=1 Tax=Christiangramia sediminicola TaxID=3073267 RepID=A0ABU1EU37_9FLAO|nr:tyrosine-type recombinase/integrase [Christiangramia sp. SM2212]MDR5591668.1 tyrosine-type recombinase/integrase [Christiangramia sp. SM2212]
MKISTPLIPLFKQFIKDTEKGKRLKKNGEKISLSTVDNYYYVLNNLELFAATGFELRICNAQKLSTRERKTEKNYWKKFYKKFTDFLYKKGCYDNYVGANIKHIRTFFNYLEYEKDFPTGGFHKMFYVRKEEVDILVLSINQLKFLIHDEIFNLKLSPAEKRIKDAFVFGCTTGLRFSDLFQLTLKNFEQQNSDYYLKIKSQKTKTYSFIKLPEYAIEIFKAYCSNSVHKRIFNPVSLYIFNKTLKNIGRKAGYLQPIHKTRERLGRPIRTGADELRFCDKMSSHMMRRTAITTMLILGMPEHLVRKISGHGADSKSFNRYVHYAQAYLDREIDKVHEKLNHYEPQT